MNLAPDIAASAAPAGPGAAALGRLLAAGVDSAVARGLIPGAAGRLRVERMHFPEGKPVQLHLRAGAGGAADAFLIAEWVGRDAPALAQAEAARLAKAQPGQGDGGRPAFAGDARLGLLFRRPGFDAKLRGLRLLHDAAFARDRLAALGCDPRARVALVAHRLGKRAVLRIAGADGIRYARLRRATSSLGAEAHARHVALWEALDGSGALAIPRPLGFEADVGLGLYEALPGRPPAFGGLDGFRAAHALSAALGALQDCALPAVPHSTEEELAILAIWMDRLGSTFPDLRERADRPFTDLRADLAALPALSAVLCHRDLHEGQILMWRGRAGLLDFDTMRRGDPALDLGNLQAHVVLAGLRDGRSRAAFLTATERTLAHGLPARVAVWRRAALLRLAALYAFSSEPRAVVRGLIGAAGRC